MFPSHLLSLPLACSTLQWPSPFIKSEHRRLQPSASCFEPRTPMPRLNLSPREFPLSPSYKKRAPILVSSKNSSQGEATAPVEDCADQESGSAILVTRLANMLNIAYRLIGPNVVKGTVTGFTAVVARTWMENSHLVMSSNWTLLLRTLAGLSIFLGITLFIAPVNHISDANIDKINYPDRPIASGKVSIKSAWIIVISSVIYSITTATLLNSKWVLPLVVYNLVLGAMYSIRPFYLKKRIVGAIFTCASLQGYAQVLLQLAAARSTLGLQLQITPPAVFMVIVTTLFGMTFGIMKDLPDVEGDTKYNVRTLASVLGGSKLLILGCGILFLTYAGCVVAAIRMPQVFRQGVMIPAHILMACCLGFQARKLHKANYTKVASKSFYLFLWNLFSAEYLLFPFI